MQVRSIAGIVACLLVVSACGDSGPNFQEHVDSCVSKVQGEAEPPNELYQGWLDRTADAFRVADEGETLIIDTGTDYQLSAALCVIEALGVSDATQSSITSTNGLMGRQDADDNELHLEWSYSGSLEMTISKS